MTYLKKLIENVLGYEDINIIGNIEGNTLYFGKEEAYEENISLCSLSYKVKDYLFENFSMNIKVMRSIRARNYGQYLITIDHIYSSPYNRFIDKNWNNIFYNAKVYEDEIQGIIEAGVFVEEHFGKFKIKSKRIKNEI